MLDEDRKKYYKENIAELVEKLRILHEQYVMEVVLYGQYKVKAKLSCDLLIVKINRIKWYHKIWDNLVK